MDENFVQLSWNAHHSAILENLSNLRDKQVFTDVTLSCGDEFYPAHRFVLSSCSSFLARALEVANCPSPVLLLHGISQQTLQHLLMYMYDGQVTVEKNDLPQLLKSAHWLGVKGLESTYAHLNSSVSESLNENANLEQETSSHLSDVWKKIMVAVTGKSTPGDLENLISSIWSDGSTAGDDSHKSTQTSIFGSVMSEDALVENKDNEELNEDTKNLLNTDDVPQCLNSSDPSFEGWDENNSVTVKSLIANGCKTERSKRSLRCKHCKRSFAVRSELAKHVRMYHDSTQNYCFHCFEEFNCDEDYKIHMKNHNIENWHNCDKCDFIGNTQKLLTKHMETHKDDINQLESSEERHTSTVRPKLDDSNMPKAVVQLEAIPIVKCSTCFKAFKGKKELWKHKAHNCYKITKSKNGFHCPLCNFISTTKLCVQEHLGKHTNNLPFQCSYCPYQSRRARFLQVHMVKRHPEEGQC